MKIVARLIYILVLFTLSACSKNDSQHVTIVFDTALKQLSTNEPDKNNFTLNQLKFYLHNFEFFDRKGNTIAMDLLDAPPWQNHQGVLIKLDKQGGQSNTNVLFNLPSSTTPNTISAIRFVLGLDFVTNHQNPLQATTPFNVSSMYWSWQTGYKFLRLDFKRDEQLFNFHLGSTGCISPSSLRPPQQVCEHPNLATIYLENFNPHKNSILINLTEVLHTLGTNSPSMHCTGNYQDNAVCEKLVSLLGLSAQTGECRRDCQRQTFFTLGDISQSMDARD